MTSSRPAVSVVIPAYNAARTIADAIDSVLNGSFRDLEVIICNDASTDNTASIITAYDDPRIKLIHHQTNQGEGPSRDHAIDAAEGQWVALLDADDQFTPDRLAHLIPVAKAHPNAIVFDDVMDCHDTPEGMRPWRAMRGPGTWESAGQSTQVAIGDWIRQQRTLMKPLIPTCCIRDHGVRHSNRRFAEDLEFFLRVVVAAHTTLWYVPRPLYMYRLAPGSMSTNPQRYTLLAETLENAMPWFAHDTSIVAALRQKATSIRRAEVYQTFYGPLIKGHVVAAARVACRTPWVLPEFFHRSVQRLPYHLSRLRHRGSHRSTL